MYDQEMLQSHTAYQSMTPRGRRQTTVRHTTIDTKQTALSTSAG